MIGVITWKPGWHGRALTGVLEVLARYRRACHFHSIPRFDTSEPLYAL